MSLLQPNSTETQSSFSSPPFPSFNYSSFTAFGDIYSGGSAADFHRFPLNPRRGYPSLPKVFNDEINGQRDARMSSKKQSLEFLPENSVTITLTLARSIIRGIIVFLAFCGK